MRVVILSRSGPEHTYVTDRIMADLGEHVDAIILSDPTPKSTRDQLEFYARRYSTRQFASRVAATVFDRVRHHERNRATRYEEVLFPEGRPHGLDDDDRVHTVAAHNGAECHRMLDDLAPDIIAVYGTAVLKPETIRKAGTVMLNMHTGISPRYRGTDTVFWPLHNEEPEWVGVTIHVLDEGIDTGPILRVGRPDFDATDDEHSLFAKCVRVGADLYVDALSDALHGTLDGETQQLADGNSYRGVDRTVSASRRVKRLVRDGLIRRHAEASATNP